MSFRSFRHRWARREIPPPPEHGIHQWLPSAARAMRSKGMTPAQAIQALYTYQPGLRRPFQPGEVEQAVDFVYGSSLRPLAPRERRASHGPSLPRISEIPFRLDLLEGIAAKLPEADAAWFKARSPIPVEGMEPELFLHHISNEGDHILCFNDTESQGQVMWHNDGLPYLISCFAAWQHGLEKGAWFLPQPVTGDWLELERLKKVHNPQGRTRRAMENVTQFRYALLESDVAPTNQWLPALAQLPLPIVSVVTSGGKSIHALFLVNATSKNHWDEIVRHSPMLPWLKTIGADQAALTAIRLTRLPGIHRGGHLQELLFLNPNPTGEPIANMVARHARVL